jgi:hypothetical protein
MKRLSVQHVPRLQRLLCLLGAIIGLLPGFSFTAPFWGLNLMEGDLSAMLGDGRVRVIDVAPGSPAEQVGFRARDLFLSPARFADVQAARDSAQLGQVQQFRIQRGEEEVPIVAGGTPSELAAIWYASPWLPISGLLFGGMGTLISLTAKHVPAPRWRSIVVMTTGAVLTVALGIATATGSVFSRWRVYQKWPMGTGAEWDFHQGLLGMLAALFLCLCAALEMRRTSGFPA